MSMLQEGTPNPTGEALVNELAWVHGIVRDNLAALQEMAQEVEGGAPAAEVQVRLRDMSATNIVWTLRRGCLRYCALVHMHHHGEDTNFFPGLRRVNPALVPVIDKLEADHVLIAAFLDRIEAAARQLSADESSRAELVGGLSGLAEHLLTHLDFEELNLNPTLRRLTSWPM